MPSEDVWLSGVFGGKSVSLEYITGQSERSRAEFRHFQVSFEDLLLHVILDVTHVQRIRDFLVIRYINVSYYLLCHIHHFVVIAHEQTASLVQQTVIVIHGWNPLPGWNRSTHVNEKPDHRVCVFREKPASSV